MYLGNFFKRSLQYGATSSIFKASVLLLASVKLPTCCTEKSCVDFNGNFAQIKKQEDIMIFSKRKQERISIMVFSNLFDLILKCPCFVNALV